MLEGLILGAIQGITEWLPVSSEGVLTLVGLKFFGKDFASSVSLAVFLHLGTFLAALFYFRKNVINLFRKENKKMLSFLFFVTLITGVVGLPLFIFGLDYLGKLPLGYIIAIVGVFLIITGLVQFKKQEGDFKKKGDLNKKDCWIVGILQGLSVLPGLSRSGLTVAGFLFRKFKDTEALKLSFLISLPVVLGGNIALNLMDDGVEFSTVSFVALATAFVVGLATISLLLKIARKINFGWFAIGFGVLTLFSLFFI